MCGIVGLIAVPGSRERVENETRRMADRIVHRGPDGGGEIWHEEASLGMRRLAIVDVVHGHQPMTNDDGSVALVYNGEIYNAPALREELVRKGVKFKTRSDTEVILRLYEHDPEHVEERLVGMWAFCIHDRKRRRVVLSRDRFGIKPLFVVDRGGSLAFASELQCFDRGLEPFSGAFTVDHASAHAMLAWSFVPAERTIFEGVRRLAPASRLTIDLATRERTTRIWWRPTPSTAARAVRSMEEACEGTESLLQRAVKEHLESDVPIATFLSGGIDSSLVSLYAKRASSNPIKAFTIGFHEKRFDESPFAKETADIIGIPIEVSMLDEEKALAQLPDALLAYDEPFGDSSGLATYMLSKVVGREYKVALGGDGGDEVFAGYSKYQILRVRELLQRTPRLRDGLGKLLRLLPGKGDRTSAVKNALRVVRRAANGLDGDDAQAYARITQTFGTIAQVAPLMRRRSDAGEFEQVLIDRFHAADGSELERTLAVDLGNSLTNDMLVKVDRASMACHLEARVPFLDHRVVEWGIGLPERFTLGSGRDRGGKRVLRTLHERHFGPKLAHRKKQGFGVPVERWLAGPFAGACRTIFARDRLEALGVLDPDQLSDGRHVEWLAKEPLITWHVFALAVWCEATLGLGPDHVRAVLSAR